MLIKAHIPFVLLALIGLAEPCLAAIRYVDDDAPANGDGLTWSTAFADLQQALDSVADPKNQVSEIRVAGGIYTPSELIDKADPRSATFSLLNGVSLTGGWAGLAQPSNPDQRDVLLFPTILTGDLLGDDGQPGSFLNYEENAYHVVTAIKLDATAVLDGFTIAAGSACCDIFQFDPRSFGGGLFNLNGDPIVISCTFAFNQGQHGGGLSTEGGVLSLLGCAFSGNLAGSGGAIYNRPGNLAAGDCLFENNNAGRGGAIYHRDGDAVLANCAFTGNDATGDHGGGIFAMNSTLDLTGCGFADNSAGVSGGAVKVASKGLSIIADCSFIGNVADHGGAITAGASVLTLTGSLFAQNYADFDGGAVSMTWTTAQIADCEFFDNSAVSYGGAIRAISLPNEATMSDCEFEGNGAGYGGGAIALAASNPRLIHCVFDGNGSNDGGALLNQASNPQIDNCLFVHNFTSPMQPVFNKGGAIFSDPGSPTITNSTFFGNMAGTGGAMYTDALSAPLVANCIFWSNSPTPVYDVFDLPLTTVVYSNVQGGWPGLGDNNIDADPQFADQANGDFSMVSGSPCIDAGDSAALPPDITTDLAGNPRVVDDRISFDMGNPNGQGAVVDMGAYEFQPPLGVCASDCGQPADGIVGYVDLMAVIDAWGAPSGPADVNGNGIVDVNDLLLVILNWGPCP